MRLLRLGLTNFCGVAQRDIPLAPDGVTVVEGPNEAGKSTLLRALDLLFKCPDSSHTSEVRDAQPVGRDVGPRVEAEFTTGPYRLRYAKQWLRAPQTSLTATGPGGTETLTGRAAHDRAEAILKETLDRDLWAALRVQQGVLSQVPLGNSPSLRAALDRAAGGGLGGPAEQGLLERVEQVRAEYLTKTGQPTGAYREARLARDQREADLQTLRGRLAEVERWLREIPRLEGDLARLGPERRRAAEALEGLQARQDRLAARAREVDALQAAVRVAEKDLEAAAQAVAGRDGLVRQATGRADQLAALRREREDAPDPAELARAVEEARSGCERAAAAAEAARAARRQAQRDLGRLRRQAELHALERRLAQAHGARRRLEEAQAVLGGAPRLDAALLARIEEAQAEVERAEARLQVAAATLEVAALAGVEVRLGEEAHALPAGASLTRLVTDHLELTLPGLLRLNLRPGTGADQLRPAAAAARAGLRRLLGDAGVPSAAAGRTELTRRQMAQQAREQAQQELRETLGAEQTLEALRQAAEALRARCAEEAAGDGPPCGPAPTVEAAEALERAAGAVEEEADAAAERARVHGEQVGQRAQQARVALAALDQRLQAAAQEHAEAERALAAARAGAGEDEALRAAAEAAQAVVAQARAGHAAAQAEYAAQGPGEVALLLGNQQGVVARLQQRQGELQSELDRARGALGALRCEGLQEEWEAAERDAAAADQRLRRVARLAAAAELLHETLRTERERVMRDYQAPYRAAIESLGRIVFGDGFGVELDADLAVARRTLGGETLPFRLLSTGAQEQVAVLARLAGATLAAGDGVPVILDDAFGYSDAERLTLLGAVLGAVGDRCQVIVLTCLPERYQGIGRARAVRLDRPVAEVADLGGAAREVAAARAAPDAPAPADVVPADAAPPPGVAPAGPAAGPAGDAATRVLGCLVGSGPLGKREILERSGVSEGEWPALIRDLLADGRVCKDGEKRGTVYRLA